MVDENMNIKLNDEYNSDLIAAIDEGTSSTRFLVFSAKTFQVITYHQVNLTLMEPKPSWIEIDPLEILNATLECMQKTCEKLSQLQFDLRRIKAVGVTNQRETTVVWDKRTGKPLYNAIVWCDMRTEELSERLATKCGGKGALQKRCGLFIHPYFSALKLRWLLENVPEVAAAAQSGSLMAGTVDTWLIWNLTGGVDSGAYVTDVSNASRTMLMNIRSLNWDKKLLKTFDLSDSYLPQIKSSSEIYGYIKIFDESKFPLNGVPISGCLGDQQAALVGETCFEEMSCKNTYGTGCFLLKNTGSRPVFSRHGLLTTVAYKFGPNQPPVYALEGSVAVAGQCLTWLRDNLDFFRDYDHCDQLLQSAHDSGDGSVYFVPAFSGLYAPYWHPQARGLIIGLTTFTRKAHIIKAAFEAVCYQTRDILEAMCKDTGGASVLSRIKLRADGGMTKNDLFMQMQADLLGATVRRDHMTESTSLGAAIAAGLASGVALWTLEQVIAQPPVADDFKPMMNPYERDSKYQKWKDAVARSKNWTKSDQSSTSSIWCEIVSPLIVPGAALLAGVFVTTCVCKFIVKG